MKRILAVASGGGHWTQLARMSEAFEGFDTLYVTTIRRAASPSGVHPVECVEDGSRSSPVRLVRLSLQLTGILLRFRPDVIVTTGAAPGLAALILGKLAGCRTLWIDSIANGSSLSMSGRLAARWSDLLLTQWEDLATPVSGARYFGRVF
jgi:hypothetical protein